MKNSTINKYLEILKSVKKENIKLSLYCKNHGISYKTILKFISDLKKSDNNDPEISEILKLYSDLKQIKDSDNYAKIEYIRDDKGLIKYYSYEIYRRNKNPLCGKFSREEMNSIYRLYSYYGDSLTQRVVSRYFVELSLIDFKRILRAFNITKASAPFAPHMIEECSEEELRQIQLREKENSFLRKAEEDRIKNNEKLLKVYAQENIELKKKLDTINNIKVTINKDFLDNVPKISSKAIDHSDNDLIIHLSDLHIGAKVETGSLYSNDWNEEELKRRLLSLINRIKDLGFFNYIVINLLGDNLDGMDNQTARRDHFMPQNMDNMEQVQTFIKTMIWFIQTIKANNLCNYIKIYSVREGNHDGILGYTASLALISSIQNIYPDIEATQFQEFFGYYEFKNRKWLICHGKDAKFMKQGLPLNLTEKSKMMLYEYLDSRNITGTGIHIIKGDLHTENINSCLKLDYRNVLSLFGASDYSNYNFSRNQYGVSYELFIGDTLVRGTFENL